MAPEYTKEDEALEIKSLRRIISAYLNYPDAAEADIRRNEKSFKRLSPEHKVLLSHMPKKFQKLRRCISRNTYFIMNMLQAFEPPLDMSRDVDEERESLGGAAQGNRYPDAPSNSKEIEKNGSSCKLLQVNEEKEEMHLEGYSKSTMERPVAIEEQNASFNACGDVKVDACEATRCCASITNGNVARDWLDPSFQLNVPPVDVDKVRCIIRNIVRDWAAEGQQERDQCYKPILEELNRLFPNRSKERPPCCLVPGAGLGRLALEISCLGFISQGNEFSYYMMICSSFILNQTQIAGEWLIYPWIHSNCNSLSDDDQLRPFQSQIFCQQGITEGFSMCGGDFVEVYNDESQEGSWDAVVTCFFLDTAHNIVEYIEIISKILKGGGIWINLGPLLYHFAEAYGADDDMSIELSLEDVKMVAYQYGFVLEKESTIETTYTANPRSMMQNRYFSAFWTMRKR